MGSGTTRLGGLFGVASAALVFVTSYIIWRTRTTEMVGAGGARCVAAAAHLGGTAARLQLGRVVRLDGAGHDGDPAGGAGRKCGCVMVYAGLFFAGLAAVLHVYIWVMESLTWTSARTRATFGISEEEAQATKELAFNQGFYNLFLAIVTVTGIVIGGTGRYGVGLALIFAGTGSMLAAAVVLLASSPDKARAASTQGIFPLIAIVLFIVGLAM